MSDIAIRVEHLSKRYRIGSAGRPRYETLYDKITGAGSHLLNKLRRPLPPQSEKIRSSHSEFIWALKDVSFEVRRGEVVGIIGRNGAGKSTLLKILSRITEPTEGRAEVYGRIGSLLEVGTGFHPELTGRENIYLNGAILGMKKAEIDRKFDEIVAFAEIEKFIDTPVKFYSSGMYVRLAFAVAAHLDPEILLVDEVLAVGDAAFQKKCLGKMGEVAGEGRTVLFVSHNMAAISNLCNSVMVLESGCLAFLGNTVQGVQFYATSILANLDNPAHVKQDVSINHLRVNGMTQLITIHQATGIEASCQVSIHAEMPHFQLYCLIQDEMGNNLVVLGKASRELGYTGAPVTMVIKVEMPPLWLKPGLYSLFWKLIGGGLYPGHRRFLSEAVSIHVFGDTDPATTHGILAPKSKWSVSSMSIHEVSSINAHHRAPKET